MLLDILSTKGYPKSAGCGRQKKSAITRLKHGGYMASSNELGNYLFSLRKESALSLRDVEKATDKKVSNAYLSQIENGKIASPSPIILFALADLYKVDYQQMMGIAGYLPEKSSFTNRFVEQRKMVNLATHSINELTEDEEKQLKDYLAFIRSKKEN